MMVYWWLGCGWHTVLWLFLLNIAIAFQIELNEFQVLQCCTQIAFRADKTSTELIYCTFADNWNWMHWVSLTCSFIRTMFKRLLLIQNRSRASNDIQFGSVYILLQPKQYCQKLNSILHFSVSWKDFKATHSCISQPTETARLEHSSSTSTTTRYALLLFFNKKKIGCELSIICIQAYKNHKNWQMNGI